MRNRYRETVFIACLLASAVSLQAQSQGHEPQQPEVQNRSAYILLAAKFDDSPATSETSKVLPDAPSATTSDAAGSTPSPVLKNQSRYGAPPAAVGGPLSVDRTVADRHYYLFMGAMFGSSILNAELTLRCLNKHASCNDVPQALQSRAALYGIGIPADLAISYLTYHMKKKNSRIWYAPSALVTGANVFLGIRAYRWTQQ